MLNDEQNYEKKEYTQKFMWFGFLAYDHGENALERLHILYRNKSITWIYKYIKYYIFFFFFTNKDKKKKEKKKEEKYW